MKKPLDQKAAIFRAILDEPWDDTHRLVYADWLEENGEPERGQFIRLQIERAGLAETDPRARALVRQENAIAKGHKVAWKADLPKMSGVAWGDFERGFVGSVVIRSAFMFHRLFRTITSLTPIESVQIRDASTLHALAISPHLSRVRDLILTRVSFHASGTLGEFADSPHLGRVLSLDLSSTRLNCGDATLLAHAKGLPRLTALNLDANQIADAGAKALAQAALARGWRRLNLSRNEKITEACRQELKALLGARVILECGES